MRRFVFAATVSAAALLAGTSLAQTAPQLRIGGSVSGQLNDSDQTLGSEDEGGQYRYEDFKISARRGQRLEATLSSDAFDAYLQVFSPGQDEPGDDPLAEDDDGLGGGTTHARLRFVAPENGVYTLRARTLSGLEGGAYTLTLSQRPPAPRAPRPTAIRVGSEVQGVISERDPESDENTVHYDAYAFRAEAGERVAIALNSDAFDPIVRVGQMAGRAFVEAASNDDGANTGLNSYLVFTAPSAGEYVIHAEPLGTDGLGDYTLKIDPAVPLATTPIEIGGTAEGELTETDGINDGGARADAYTFTATAGQRIDATLKSEAFDSYLELFDADGQSLDEDNDGGEDGKDSRLISTIKADGVYTLQVRATGDVTTGAYTLALAEAEPEPEPVALAFATLTQGEIKEEGARDDDGRGYDAYVFTGEAGTRVQVVMRSGDFDTYLQISRAGVFEALASDDDGLGEGTDSRLSYTLPESGEYVIRASPLGSEEKGLYSIELTDRGPQPEPGSILIGSTARGTLSENDGISDDGAYFDAYAVTVTEGDKLNVSLTSNDFDAFVDIGRDKDGTWESVISDDDSLSDTHARVKWTVEDAGDYIIRARSFAQGETGAYALIVERRP
jgi:hypothetical protein